MKFLVALDGSEKDASAVAAAARLAATAGAEVVLLNVLSPWLDTASAHAPTPAERLDEVTAARQTYLDRQLTAFASGRATAWVERLHWPAGRGTENVAECIARVARESAADILVMASKRASGVPGLLLGSTAQALLRSSPCPVLVVRPDERSH